MLSLGAVCVDASGKERFIFADVARSIPRCFFTQGALKRSKETSNIRNVLSFEPVYISKPQKRASEDVSAPSRLTKHNLKTRLLNICLYDCFKQLLK